jgi:hypothetical protein
MKDLTKVNDEILKVTSCDFNDASITVIPIFSLLRMILLLPFQVKYTSI